MKIRVKRIVEIEVTALRMVLPVRYGTEDIAADFPLRGGDTWTATVDLASGKIREWPTGAQAAKLHMKVCDTGSYYLLGPDGADVAKIEEDYVPDAVPGRYGDYVELDIAADGTITNWRKKPTFAEFFPDPDGD